jgi:hypothetical protein
MAVTSKVTVYWDVTSCSLIDQFTWQYIPEVNHHTKVPKIVNLILLQFSSDWWLVYIVGITEHYTYKIKHLLNMA